MSATRKMSREIFLRISAEIFQKLNAFKSSIPTFGSVYQTEIQRRPSPASLQQLESWGKKQDSSVYNHIINSAIRDIHEYRESFKTWVDNESHDFCENVEAALTQLKEINYLYQPEDYCTDPCSRIQHRIWFGSMLPDQYQEFICNFMRHNPFHRLILWIDSTILSGSEKNEIKSFCDFHNIVLEDIRTHTDLLNSDLVIRELNESTIDPNKCVHYARASDLARIGILYKFGGAYCDTDTDTKKEILDYSLPLGVAVCSTSLGQHVKDNTINFSQLGYDYLLGTPGNGVLKLAAQISYSDYETYSKSNHQLWYQSKQSEVHLLVTCNLTGHALHHAIQCYLPTTDLNQSELLSLFVYEHSMCSYYQKSWLKSLEMTYTIELDAAAEDANLFVAELKQSRLEKFPIPKGFYSYSLFRDDRKLICEFEKVKTLEEKTEKVEPTISESSIKRLTCSML